MNQRKTLNAEATTTRPYWQTSPCPAWCTAPHHDGDYPGDREHHSHYLGVPLTQEDPNAWPETYPGQGEAYTPQQIMVALRQPIRDAEPLIEMLHGDEPEKYVTMTLAEVAEVGRNMLRLVALGHDDYTHAKQPAPGGAAGCQPWCVEHDDKNAICHSVRIPVNDGNEYGNVGLTHVADEGTVVWLSDTSMTPDDAEHLAYVLLAQAQHARETS